jgi:hypothetical protein
MKPTPCLNDTNAFVQGVRCPTATNDSAVSAQALLSDDQQKPEEVWSPRDCPVSNIHVTLEVEYDGSALRAALEGPLQSTQLHRCKFVALLSSAVGCMRGIRWDV